MFELTLWQLMYIFIIGIFLALLEIEIEGADGWAKNLPTKRIKVSWYAKSGKEVTGYHLILQIFLLLFFHWPLVLAESFSLELEVLILTQYFLFLAYWDFLWFVLNPQFKLKNFKKGGVRWHTIWFIGLPVEYWLAIVASFILPWLVLGPVSLLLQLKYLVTYLIFTLITIIIYRLIYPAPKW